MMIPETPGPLWANKNLKPEEKKPTPKVICRECLRERSLPYEPAIVARLIFKSLCMECDYWLNLVALADSVDSVRIKGNHFFIGDPSVRRDDLRYITPSGEKHHVIKFHNGVVLETYNLFFLGPVPARFKLRLSDNAQFVYPPNRRTA